MDKQEDPRVAAALTLRVAADADAERIAEAIVAAWHQIDRDLAPIIGSRGVAALYKRSLHLTANAHAWLARPQAGSHEGVPVAMDLDALKARLAQQDAARAAAGGEAFLRTFYDLLTTLIGPSLTGRLLHSVWTTFLSGPPAQDTSP
jgi:hypothetical protein